MWYVSGNRDEDMIENADEFVIERRNARNHIAFGFGIHRCLGLRLAEMQLRIVWEEILKRFDTIDVVDEPKWIYSNFVKGYETLPVRNSRISSPEKRSTEARRFSRRRASRGQTPPSARGGVESLAGGCRSLNRRDWPGSASRADQGQPRSLSLAPKRHL